jgi:Arc/MetJ-type ribon-helix-helix transcriptional regulator
VEQMNKLFADGGMMDDSGESVNGVEVPPGSLREEVADDIPAQLSEGEFVVPADVVRYIGLEKLMAMRDKAKQGLQRMNEMGQMGNAEEVANPDQTFSEQGDEDFEAEIDDIMAEEGDDAMPEGFARGGIVTEADIPKHASGH